MTSLNDDFTLENIDEQLEHSARPFSDLPSEQRHAANVRLVHDLQRLYHDDSKDAHSLDRVLTRLNGVRRSEFIDRYDGMNPGRDKFASLHVTSIKNRKLSLLAAVLVVSFVAGSLAVVLTMARQAQDRLVHTPTTQIGGPQQTPASVPPAHNIYTASSDALIKLDGQTHAELWRYQVDAQPDGSPFLAPLVVADDSVYITTDNGDIHALDSATGKQRWITQQNNQSGMIVADGLIYLKQMQSPPGGPYTLYALNASNGRPHLTYTLDGVKAVGEPFLAAANQVLFVGVDNHLLALNARTGAQIWQSNIAEQERITSLALEQETLYVNSVSTSNDGEQANYFEYGYALDQEVQKWRHRLPIPTDLLTLTTPHVANGILYYSYNGRVFAWDASKGTVLWNYEQAGSIKNTMHIADDVIYIGEFASRPEKIVALHATTGKQLWQAEFKGIPGSVRTGNGKLYINVTNNSSGITLYELSPHDGSVLWNHLLAKQPVSSVPLTVAP